MDRTPSDEQKKAKKNVPKRGRGGPILPPMPGGQPLWANILSTVLIFLILISGYSLVAETRKEKEAAVPISTIARDIGEGKVSVLLS